VVWFNAWETDRADPHKYVGSDKSSLQEKTATAQHFKPQIAELYKKRLSTYFLGSQAAFSGIFLKQ
jgi:D-serine dehydratase